MNETKSVAEGKEALEAQGYEVTLIVRTSPITITFHAVKDGETVEAQLQASGAAVVVDHCTWQLIVAL